MSSLQLVRSNLSKATDEQLGGALTALYRDAQDAEMAFLKFGAAFHAIEELVSSTRGGNSPKRGPGAYGFDSWLRDYAPEVAPPTARRYRDIARATAEKFRIENPVDVFTLPPEQLSEADRAKRAKALEFVSDKSMRGIQLELGLRHVPKGGNLGGVRGKAKHEPPAATLEEERAACNGFWHGQAILLNDHLLVQRSWRHLPEQGNGSELTLGALEQLLQTALTEIRKVRAGRAAA